MKRLHIRSVIVPALASLLVAGTPALAHADTESAAAAYARNPVSYTHLTLPTICSV